MKKEEIIISANEINRYLYCPYQWYYKRTYGEKELTRQYKALNLSHSNHESYYVKGTKHHTHYYKAYQMKRLIIVGLVVAVIVIVGWVVLGWK